MAIYSPKPYKLLTLGGTSYITTTDQKTISKGWQVWENGRQYLERENRDPEILREAIIYQHLGEHPQILKFFKLEKHCEGVHSLRLEFAPHGCVRQYIQEHQDQPPPLNTRLQMALDVAHGVAYLHSKGVYHMDMSGRNLVLFDDFRVKICDFGASLMEGHDFEIETTEEPQYEMPLRGRLFDDRPQPARELFALGSAIYEIVYWQRPFQGLSDGEVEARYAREEFPYVGDNVVGSVIRGCWLEQFDSAQDCVAALTQCAEVVENKVETSLCSNSPVRIAAAHERVQQTAV